MRAEAGLQDSPFSKALIGCVVAVAAFSLSDSAVAQQKRTVVVAPPSEDQIATSPAVDKLKGLIEAVNSGDETAMRAFSERSFVPTKDYKKGLDGLPPSGVLLDLYRKSHGLKLVSMDMAQDSMASATVRNNLTEMNQRLTVDVELQAPYRIKGMPQFGGGPPLNPVQADASAQADEARQLEEVGSFIQRLADADLFSGVVLIARGDRPLFLKGYGYANRAKSIPNSIETPFMIGSVNKLFTSLAIGRLVETGKLSYEDPLSKFIPDFPNSETAKKIKIKHLLSHTSGLGNYWTPEFFESIETMRDVESIMKIADRQMEFEPGTSWRYSNTGYLLAGRVIEVVSGQDYYDYMRNNVFVPAGMMNTGFPHYDRAQGEIALPYEVELKGGRLEQIDQSPRTPRRGAPAGGGISTAPDLLRLASALLEGKIVSPATFHLHSTPKPELNSPRYGYGFMNVTYGPGRVLVGHNGGDRGQCAEFAITTGSPLPYTVAILSNSAMESCVPVRQKIFALLASLPAIPPGTKNFSLPATVPKN